MDTPAPCSSKGRRFKPFVIKKGIVTRTKQKLKKMHELTKSKNESTMHKDPKLIKLKSNNNELSRALSEQKEECNALFEEKLRLQEELLRHHEVLAAHRKEMQTHEEEFAKVQDVFRGALQMLLTLTDHLNAGMETVLACRRRSRSVSIGAARISLGRSRSGRRSHTDGVSPFLGGAPTNRKLNKVLPIVAGNVISHPTIVLPRVSTSGGWYGAPPPGPRRVTTPEEDEEEEEEPGEETEEEEIQDVGPMPAGGRVQVSAPPIDLSMILEHSSLEERSLTPLPEAQVVVTARERMSGDAAWLQLSGGRRSERRQRRSGGVGWRRQTYTGVSPSALSPARPAPRRRSPETISPLQPSPRHLNSALWSGGAGVSPAAVRMPNVSLQRLALTPEDFAQYSPIASGSIANGPARIVPTEASPGERDWTTRSQYTLMSMELDESNVTGASGRDVTGASGRDVTGADGRAPKRRRRKRIPSAAYAGADTSAAGPSGPPNDQTLPAVDANTTGEQNHSIVISRNTRPPPRAPAAPAEASAVPTAGPASGEPSVAAEASAAPAAGSAVGEPAVAAGVANDEQERNHSVGFSSKVKRSRLPMPVRSLVAPPPFSISSASASREYSPTSTLAGAAAAVAASKFAAVRVAAAASKVDAARTATGVNPATETSDHTPDTSQETSLPAAPQQKPRCQKDAPSATTDEASPSVAEDAQEEDADLSIVSVVLPSGKPRRGKRPPTHPSTSSAATVTSAATSVTSEASSETSPPLPATSAAASTTLVPSIATYPVPQPPAKASVPAVTVASAATGNAAKEVDEAEPGDHSLVITRRIGRPQHNHSSDAATANALPALEPCAGAVPRTENGGVGAANQEIGHKQLQRASQTDKPTCGARQYRKIASGSPDDPLEGPSHIVWLPPACGQRSHRASPPPLGPQDDIKLSLSPVVLLDRSSADSPAELSAPPANPRRLSVDTRRESVEIGRPAAKRRQKAVVMSHAEDVINSVVNGVVTGGSGDGVASKPAKKLVRRSRGRKRRDGGGRAREAGKTLDEAVPGGSQTAEVDGDKVEVLSVSITTERTPRSRQNSVTSYSKPRSRQNSAASDARPPQTSDKTKNPKVSVSGVAHINSRPATPSISPPPKLLPASTTATAPSSRSHTPSSSPSCDIPLAPPDLGRQEPTAIYLSGPSPVLPSAADLVTGAAVVTGTEADMWPPGLLRVSPTPDMSEAGGSRASSLEPDATRRRRKQVSYREPTLNKKLRR